jgi:DNA-binding CsgD family transcriptional regulator
VKKRSEGEANTAGSSPSFAVPFPAGASLSVAEEPLLVPHFTAREQHVGGWLAEGKNDAEIARILDLGTETIRTHIKSMREKTGVENRNALFAWIWRQRWSIQFRHDASANPVKYT